jgi:hypothetical protein
MDDMSLRKRNLITLQSARDIFRSSKGGSWADFKSKIAGEQIREFYEVQAALWPPTTDWARIMPIPDGATHLTEHRPV